MNTLSKPLLRRYWAEQAHEDWYLPRKPAHEMPPNRVALHDFVVDHIGANTDLRYLEFGVAEGWSIRRFATKFTNPNTSFTGFDSFIGLPESWNTFPAGKFSTEGRLPNIADSRVQFVPGWFQNTVPGFLASMYREPPKVTLVHFDADLYSSTMFLLTAFWWHLGEYYFIMDEFFGEEMVAMRDFASAYPVEIEFYAYENSPKQLPAKIFGKLRAGKMVVVPNHGPTDGSQDETKLSG